MKINRRNFIQKSAILASSGLAAKGLGREMPFVNSSSNWSEIRKAFPLHSERTYLNNGTFGPSPYMVIDELKNQFERINTTGNYGNTESCSETIAEFIKVDKSEIALTHNTSEGINIMAWGLKLKPGDEVILTSHEHVGNALPWLNRAKIDGIKLRVFKPSDNQNENLDKIKKLKNSKTRVIAVPHITCTTGLVFPIKEIASYARRKGIITAIDGAHGLGSFDLDMIDLGVDMYATCGHKWLLGPAGTGAAFISKNILDEITPIHVGAYSDDGFELSEERQTLSNYAANAHKFFYGTQSKAQYAGMRAAAEFHLKIGKKAIQERLRVLNDHLHEGLAQFAGPIEILSPTEKASRINMVTFRHEKRDYKEVGEILKEEKFRVRLIHESGLNAIRVSTHIYNSKAEIDALLNTIERRLLA